MKTDITTDPDATSALHDGCLNTMLRLAGRRVTQLYDAALASTGLSAGQARLMWVVAELDNPDGAGPVLQDVARRLGLEVSALTHAMRPLVRDGIVIVTRGATDGRTKHARLSPDGMAQLDRMLELYQATNRRIDAVLGAEHTAELRRLAGLILSPGFEEDWLANT